MNMNHSSLSKSKRADFSMSRLQTKDTIDQLQCYSAGSKLVRKVPVKKPDECIIFG